MGNSPSVLGRFNRFCDTYHQSICGFPDRYHERWLFTIAEAVMQHASSASYCAGSCMLNGLVSPLKVPLMRDSVTVTVYSRTLRCARDGEGNLLGEGSIRLLLIYW